jgi:hypothetical protein
MAISCHHNSIIPTWRLNKLRNFSLYTRVATMYVYISICYENVDDDDDDEVDDDAT